MHLLGHGIYAFKTSAAGGATDLVLSKPLTGEDASAADFLVLTEWKRVVDEETTVATAASAREQATAYTQHLLAGVDCEEFATWSLCRCGNWLPVQPTYKVLME